MRLRLPTGGEKTLLSAHTIRLAGESYIENDYPFTLGLAPTNTIKQQTLETLKNPEACSCVAWKKDKDGRDVYQQLNQKLAGI